MSEFDTLLEQAKTNHIAALEHTVDQFGDTILSFASELAETFEAGNKVLVFGNGGSACDAMHFAGECVGRFVNDRRPLPAIALTADPGILTAIGNDYGFEAIFARQLQAHAKPGDKVIAISTSGKSKNVLQALEVARDLQLHTLLLTGKRGETLQVATQTVAVPTEITAHIQEIHIWILQLIIALIEKKIF